RRVQRQRRRVLRVAVPVGELGFFLLEPGAVAQQDLAQLARGFGRDDLSAKSVAHQRGQVAAVVEVRVAQHDAVDLARRQRKPRPVAIAQLLEPLEQAAVEQDLPTARVEQVARAGDGVGGAGERELHWKKSLTRSIQPLVCGLCFGSFSDASSSRSSCFCLSVSRTGVSITTCAYRSPG